MREIFKFCSGDISNSAVGSELLTWIKESRRRLPIDVGGSVNDGN